MSENLTSNIGVPKEKVLFRETVQGGANWSHVLKRGTTLRIIDTEGGTNVSALFYNFELLSERYNMADTLKAQHISHLKEGCALYSDMGRILVSLPRDTSGWHDTISGHSTAEHLLRRFGQSSFQEQRNRFQRNARDNFLMEMGKYDLGLRDLVPNVNFFSKVSVTDTGELRFDASHARAGAFVDVRAEMNTLVILNTCVHPLATGRDYDPKPAELVVWSSGGPGPDDPVRKFRPENERGLLLTERYFL
ncbi:MAG: urea carboxylase-associated family protein [Verrucomicrobiota bacterium]|nr:urea carboxylase-associated family protein [Verrucomicrobiota bacterium]